MDLFSIIQLNWNKNMFYFTNSYFISSNIYEICIMLYISIENVMIFSGRLGLKWRVSCGNFSKDKILHPWNTKKYKKKECKLFHFFYNMNMSIFLFSFFSFSLFISLSQGSASNSFDFERYRVIGEYSSLNWVPGVFAVYALCMCCVNISIVRIRMFIHKFGLYRNNL